MNRFLNRTIGVFICLWMFTGCAQGPDREIEYKLYVTHSELNMIVGEKVQITASPTSQTFTWESTDPAVASVTSTGLVTALQDGVCFINVTSSGGLFRAIPVDVVAH